MRIMTISDLHAPFHHEHALDFLRGVQRQVKPDVVVCMGDEIDAHGWSSHDRDPDAPGQGDELNRAIRFLKRLYKLFPSVRVCKSNHTERAYRKAIKVGLPKKYLRETREVLEAPPDWRWADYWIVNDIIFEHGEGYSGQNAALSAARSNRRNTVIGHVHAWAGVQYHAGKCDCVWGMNTGCLVDPTSLAMAYAKQNPNKQMIGTGIICEGIPTFLPL